MPSKTPRQPKSTTPSALRSVLEALHNWELETKKIGSYITSDEGKKKFQDDVAAATKRFRRQIEKARKFYKASGFRDYVGLQSLNDAVQQHPKRSGQKKV